MATISAVLLPPELLLLVVLVVLGVAGVAGAALVAVVLVLVVGEGVRDEAVELEVAELEAGCCRLANCLCRCR